VAEGCVDAGSGPDRDDFGLPPVDIEIPDDARELDADVQAYHRELRARRRKRRSDRLRRPLSPRRHPLGREGITLPLLACCLMVALITSTLLVMFAADQTGEPPAAGSRSATSHPPTTSTQGTTGQAGQPLPAAELTVGSAAVPLRLVTADGPSMLALIPPGCGCVPALRQLAGADGAAHVRLYLVGTPGEMQQVSQLAAAAGEGPGQVANDTGRVLSRDYRENGLTTLLVGPGGVVAYIARDVTMSQGMGLVQAEVRQLGAAGTGR
jgi:hypothetical protein